MAVELLKNERYVLTGTVPVEAMLQPEQEMLITLIAEDLLIDQLVLAKEIM